MLQVFLLLATEGVLGESVSPSLRPDTVKHSQSLTALPYLCTHPFYFFLRLDHFGQLQLTLNLKSSFLSLLSAGIMGSAGITGICHHAQLYVSNLTIALCILLNLLFKVSYIVNDLRR